MLRGYTLPRPGGRSSLAPPLPWHYAGDCLAVEFEADPAAVSALLPAPLEFADARCCVYFIEWQFTTDGGDVPSLAAGRLGRPAVHELVRLKSRDVQVGPIMKGEASLALHDHPRLELAMLRPRRTGAGYRFSFALTVDDLETLADLRAP